MLIVGGSEEAAELSLLLFLLPAGLVFDRAVALFVVFYFQRMEKERCHYWLQYKRGSKVETRSCLTIKRARKLNESYQSADCLRFPRSICGRRFFTKWGIFLIAFFSWLICFRSEKTSLRKQPFLLPLRRWGRFARNSVCDFACVADALNFLYIASAN